MDRTQAERLIADHVKPIFGFALKRCASIQDAEDVAQEITLRTYQALLTRDDVADPIRYIWTVAHNVLANHYRDRSRTYIGVFDPGMAETDPESALLDREAVTRLQQEIACLGRTQREIIVAYYFHGRKQADIAASMNLPVGTVKWHLFEAKKELKKNMENARNMNTLMFDPIRFTAFGTKGSIGDEGSPWRVFRSTLNQNIAYATWRTARTIPEIAGALGVSPVFVEDAVEYLTEQCFLLCEDGKYRCAILLTEVDDQLTTLSDRMCQDAAKLIAPSLTQALLDSDIWSDEGFYPGQKPTSTRFSTAPGDGGFALWALIPWCIASSQPDKAIGFNDVATLRPDGGRNIVHATLAAPGAVPPALYSQMNGRFSGPCWNEQDGLTLWQLDTCWSERRIGKIYQHEGQATLSLLRRLLAGETLTAEEYARLTLKGLVHVSGDPEALFTATVSPVWLRGKAIQEKLLGIVRKVYAEHASELEALRTPYAKALLADTPAHLQKLRRYVLQNVYQSDWFIMHCLHTLVEAGTLLPPTGNERQALHTIIISE